VRAHYYPTDAQGRWRGIAFYAATGLDVEDTSRRAALATTESDELGSFDDRPVLLVEHCEDVRLWALRFAKAAGVSRERIEDIGAAGGLHDFGKADERFRALLNGGNPYGPDGSAVLAKSGRRSATGAWERAGLPAHWRHEALSVRLARLHPAFAAAHDPALILWLIGTHHGYGRPFFPHADALDGTERGIDLPEAFGGRTLLEPGNRSPQSLAFDFEGQDWAQMFQALKRKYGIWGLARLEAFVRLADHRASEAGAPPEAAPSFREAAECPKPLTPIVS
jgi:CRISPR-associated endonuclease/helicase Cas3